MLAKSCLFTHPADTEKHYHSFEVMFLANSHSPLSSVFGFDQLHREISGFYQLVANCVFLPFGAEQEGNSGFIFLFLFFLLKTWLMRAVGRDPKQESCEP